MTFWYRPARPTHESGERSIPADAAAGSATTGLSRERVKCGAALTTMTRGLEPRGLVRYLVALAMALAAPVMAGPVDLYLDGPRFCPHDVPPGAVRINEVQAIARTRTMLPVEFCGPNTFVSGCTFDTDNQYDSWRIYVHQYKLVGGAREKGGLAHTYLILDAVGNCLAHIPGTEFGASN